MTNLNTTVLKIAVIGSKRCGKSSLCRSITERTVYEEYISTIGVDYYVKNIENKKVSLCIWDLTGDINFLNIIEIYIEKCSFLIFCYSATDINSFEDMLYMYKRYKNTHFIENKTVLIVLTKIDSIRTFKNYKKVGKEFAQQNNHIFIKTSSFTKEGITEVINECLKSIKHSDKDNNDKNDYCNII